MGLQEQSSNPEDFSSVPAAPQRIPLCAEGAEVLWQTAGTKGLPAGRMCVPRRADILQQAALLLHPPNHPGDHLTTTTAGIAVAERSSHTGISLNYCFAQQLRFQPQRGGERPRLGAASALPCPAACSSRVIFHPDIRGLTNASQLEQLNKRYWYVCQDFMEFKYPHQPSRFPDLMMCLPEIRYIAGEQPVQQEGTRAEPLARPSPGCLLAAGGLPKPPAFPSSPAALLGRGCRDAASPEGLGLAWLGLLSSELLATKSATSPKPGRPPESPLPSSSPALLALSNIKPPSWLSQEEAGMGFQVREQRLTRGSCLARKNGERPPGAAPPPV